GAHHQHPHARKLPAQFVHFESGQGGDRRIRHRGLCSRDHRARRTAWRQAKGLSASGRMMSKSPKSIIDRDLIHELTALLDETGLTEIEIEQDGKRIRVARGTTVAAAPSAAVPAEVAPQTDPRAAVKPIDP